MVVIVVGRLFLAFVLEVEHDSGPGAAGGAEPTHLLLEVFVVF